jgi:YggT family protein
MPASARREFSMLLSLLDVIDLLLRVVTYIIIAQAILSWLVAFNVINTHSDFVRSFLNALDRMTEPLYRPIRRILPDFGGLDFSPLVVLLIIMVLRKLLAGAELSIAASYAG